MSGFRSGFVGVIGRPNVGKSTLVNQLVGQKVAIVSDKPQTTRNRIHGIIHRPNGQVVLVDTPGVHQPLHRLGRYMNRVAHEAAGEVDVIWFLRDATQPRHPGDEPVAERVRQVKAPVFVVFNKADALDSGGRGRLPTQEELAQEIPNLAGVHVISALLGEGVEELLQATLALLPEGPRYYPEDWISDHPQEFVAAELIREKVLLLTRDEVPHSVAVEIERFSQRPDKPLIDIEATIYVERESQKPIIIGKGGSMLKQIGQLARLDMEAFLGQQVNLKLWVKVKPDWREKEGALQQLGYR